MNVGARYTAKGASVAERMSFGVWACSYLLNDYVANNGYDTQEAVGAANDIEAKMLNRAHAEVYCVEDGMETENV